MKIKTIVNLHLNRERLDVLLSVVIPLVLMIESGYANGWVYAGGNLSLTDPNTYLALFRGFFLEALIFAMFKLTRILFLKGQWRFYLIALLPLSIGLVTMIVSAGLNIGWANRSGEMQAVVSMVNQFLPDILMGIFKTGIGLIFPIAVGAFALLDVGHLVEEVLQASAHMNDRAAKVQVAEMHREQWMKKQQASVKELDTEYEQMARADARNMVNRVKQGDYSFGLNDIVSQTSPLPSVTRIQPVPSAQPLLLPGQSGQPPVPPAITGQFRPSPAFPTGNTQQIQMPSGSAAAFPSSSAFPTRKL
jgi:hypothetical protein